MGEKFEVRDRRTMDSQGNPIAGEAQGSPRAEAAVPPKKEQGPAAPKTPAAKTEEQAAHEGKPKDIHEGQHGEHHEGQHREHREGHVHDGPDFLSFIVNLAGMAYMTMGLGEVPTEPNLPEAKYIIDSIGMLKEKTKGNLSAEEEKGVSGLIYELKVNFSKVASGKKSWK